MGRERELLVLNKIVVYNISIGQRRKTADAATNSKENCIGTQV